MSGLGADSPGGQGGGEDVVQAVVAVRRQLKGALQGVNKPPQHQLAGGPTGIALAKFFQGDWFAPRGRVVSRIMGAEDSVIEVEKLPPECVEGRGIALAHQNFVVDEHVSIAEGAAVTAGPDRGGHGDRPLQRELSRRGRWNGEREGGFRHRGGGCGGLERMWRWRPGGVDDVIGQVCDRLGRAAKVWWAFGPTHVKNQGHGDQRGLARSDGEGDPEQRDVGIAERDPIETIGNM